MKTFEVEIPEGHQIDKENSTFEKIVFKKIESDLPDSVEEIQNRNWFVCSSGSVTMMKDNTINQLSTKERAEAFLALMQLVELRDYVNGDWKADWSDPCQTKYTIRCSFDKIFFEYFTLNKKVLHFKSDELRDKFYKKYKKLIETAKELL